MKFCLHVLFFFVFVYSQRIWAANDKKFVPPGVRYQLLASPNEFKMPPLDSVKAGICSHCYRSTKLKSLPFAYNYEVNITPQTGGIWQTLPDGDKAWFFEVTSKGAYALSLVFAGLNLPDGHKVFVYNPSDPENYEVFTKDDNVSDIFVTLPLAGEKIRVEYLLPRGSHEAVDFKIVKVSHAFLDILHTKSGMTGYGASGPCNVDINCPIGANWQKDKGSVTRLMITKTSVSEYCSGVLLNNTAFNGKPFLLTAQHCIEDSVQAKGTIFYFEYESPTCHGPNGNDKKIIRGSNVRALNGQLDFTLVELNKVPTANFHPYYAGWFNQENIKDTVVAIHHPEGDVKKISFDYSHPVPASFDTYLFDSHWRILRWDVATTEQGSSGCPLFNRNHQVIGTLSGGDASCDSSVNDYFERLSKAWSFFSDSSLQLRYWLDPLKENPEGINGYNPYTNYSCDTFTNFEKNENPFLLSYDKGTGHLAGNNSDSIKSFAESYLINDTLYINGLYMNVGSDVFSTADSIEVFILQHEGSFIKTDTTLHEVFRKAVALSSLGIGENLIDIYPAVRVDTNFLIGFTIPYGSSDFAIYSSQKKPAVKNTAYVFYKGQWVGVDEIFSEQFGVSFDLRPLICSATFSEVPIKIDKRTTVTLFPNPVKDVLNIRLPVDNSPARVEIYDISGKKVYSGVYKPLLPEFPVNISNLAQGLYILKLNSNIVSFSGKFVVSK